LYGERRRRKQ
jgi:hypothetical protein